jgi:tRNA modification GTPase
VLAAGSWKPIMTIFALASGKGKAGVSLVRISGQGALAALKSLGVEGALQPRKAYLKSIKNLKNNEVIDEALVTYFPAPNSFTGEDVIEICIHGSIAVLNNLFDYLSSLEGLRMAEAGEFSRRAFENGKLDLTQIEGLADLIDAETAAQSKQALRQMQGQLSKIYENWRFEIIEILAFIEAYIDFPDEDIPQNLDIQMQEKVAKFIAEIETHISDKSGERLRDGIVATIIGAPNVGKSTLINLLAKRDIAIVSEIAGTTRDSIETHLDIAGFPICLIDTAGLRESEDKIEREGVKRALEKAENADLKIIVFDAAEYPNFNRDAAKLIDENSIVLINKIDAKSLPDDVKINGVSAISISANKNININILKDKLKAEVESRIQLSESPTLTRKRHRERLLEAVKYLHKFITARQSKLPIELCAEELRFAAKAIGKITGRIDVEDLLDKIFSSFCIGK